MLGIMHKGDSLTPPFDKLFSRSENEYLFQSRIMSQKTLFLRGWRKLGRGPKAQTILRTFFVLFSIYFLHLEVFESNTTSDWLNRVSRNCVTFKFTNLEEKRQRMFLKMIGEYGPRTKIEQM